jgi:HD-GYP domain-containing protein (c-di-GMP phosphodiesterase class II)
VADGNSLVPLAFCPFMLKLKRSKILHHVLLVLMLVSIGPLGFYGWQVIELNREKLERTEKLSQLSIAKSLAREIAQYVNGYREQILGFASAVELQGSISGIEDSSTNHLLQRKLEELAKRSKNLLYINIVNNRGKGVRAGRYDPEGQIQPYLTRAFLEGSKDLSYISEPLALEIENRTEPVIVMSTPINSEKRWIGVTTVIIDLNDILRWVTENSTAGKAVYVVDFDGRIVVHPNQHNIVTGMDFSKIGIVREFIEAWSSSRGNVRLPGTRPFKLVDNGREEEMLGTYYAIPDTSWGVIVQVNQKDAFKIVAQMKGETIKWGVWMLMVSLFVGWISARSITTPIQQLAESTRLIAKRDFSKKITIKSRTEIGELAETFNQMAADLELYIQQIKRASKENRELFLGTIRALAAAIDEKDPYTRGHSDRVTNYSIIIARIMGLDEAMIETIRISALLHDVGKIGIDDKVLKKPGVLTPEEFEIMKQHPVKGAHIMKSIEQMRDMIPGMKYHHEQWDGNGYPDRLKGEAIPLIARIISVADTFDAMTTNRPYQKAIELEYTLNKIRGNAGIKYDPEVVQALMKAIENGDINVASPPNRALAI